MSSQVYRILIADDEEALTSVLARSIQRHMPSSEVVTVNNGSDAISRAREIDPDLVVLDIVMPQKDGWEALSEIRGFNSAVKAIMVTGNASISDEQKDSVSAVLFKPMRLEDVRRTVESVLGIV